MMEQTRPRISVVVPVYNVETYAERCLASLAAQTYPSMEIIVIDDSSTDHSGRLCDAWAAHDRRFQVVHLSQNKGLSAARNEGVRRASGTYIAFVDSDDYAEPGLLETLYHVLTETRADVSICGNEGLRLADGPARTYSPQEAARCLARRGPFLWTAWGKLFPTELAKQIPFDRQALCCEDLLFFYQVLKRVRRLTYVPAPLYHYVCRPGSLVNHGVTKKRCRVLTLLEQICEDAAVCFPQAKACFGQVALDTAASLAGRRSCSARIKKARRHNWRSGPVYRFLRRWPPSIGGWRPSARGGWSDRRKWTEQNISRKISDMRWPGNFCWPC